MLKLQFTIDAVDKATAKLTGINKAVEQSVERVTEPYRKLRASINGLVDNSGLDKVKDAWAGLKDLIMKLPGVAALSLAGAFAVMHRTIDSIDRTVDAHVKTLRAKLKAVAPEVEPIRTLRGTGYALHEDLPPTQSPP